MGSSEQTGGPGEDPRSPARSCVSGSRPVFFMPPTRLRQLCFLAPVCGESCLGPVPIFEPASCFNIYALCVCVCVCALLNCVPSHMWADPDPPCIAHDPWCVFPRRQQDGVLKIDLVSGAEKVCVCVRVCAYK